jgi:hypothetical protein
VNRRKPCVQTPVVSRYPAPTPVDNFVLLFLPPCSPHSTPLATGSLESGLLVYPLLGGPARHRPFAPTFHLHQRKSSRKLHLQYSANSQSTPHCQSLIIARSDHPPVLGRSGPHVFMLLEFPSSSRRILAPILSPLYGLPNPSFTCVHDTSSIQGNRPLTNQELVHGSKGPLPHRNGLETLQTPPYSHWDPPGSHPDERRSERSRTGIGRPHRSTDPTLRRFAPIFHVASPQWILRAFPGGLGCPHEVV